jgi:hypothetical protein
MVVAAWLMDGIGRAGSVEVLEDGRFLAVFVAFAKA